MYACSDVQMNAWLPPPAHLVCSGVEVGKCHVQQVVLQRVDSRGNGQLQCLHWLMEDLLPEDATQSTDTVT